MKKNKKTKQSNTQESEKTQNEQENEEETLNLSKAAKNKKMKEKNKNYYLVIFLYVLIIFSFIGICIYIKTYYQTYQSINDIKSEQKKNFVNSIVNMLNQTEPANKIVNETNNNTENVNISSKVGVAFVFKSIFGNGIGRMLQLICSELARMEKYDIYLITGGGYRLDFPFDEKVKIIRIAGNLTKIKAFDKTSNIKIYILHNDLTPSSINWYKRLNGGKLVIGVMHGVYLSSIYSNQTGVYPIWINNKYYDASVHVIADDYYVHKRIGLNNTFFIPNLYTFDPSLTPSSNLTYNNIMIMGRELDRIKGGLYGIKAMDLIRKEIPDAKLYFISANYKITLLENLIDELNLRSNIEVLHFTSNISHYFLNSSILLCPSLSEASPLVMNEGKAHGLPVVAFNVSYSPPYQKGVIVTQVMNYTGLAEECIKLLKDYNYRKIKGLESKLSLNRFSNRETVDKWDKLFEVLLNNDTVGYKKLQDYTYERYYDEDQARDHLESNWKMGQIFNRYFCCHDFNDMLKLDYITKMKGCTNQSLCK